MFSHFNRAVCREERGQSTVEAAFAIPILLLGVLLLIQPGIILYDRVVMESAAAEGCRVLATLDEGSVDVAKNYIRRRLGAVPQQDNFHVHSTACTWEIECSGAGTAQPRVVIRTEVRPLPLLGFGAELLDATNESGNFVVEVDRSISEQPRWVSSSVQGSNAASWVGAWLG